MLSRVPLLSRVQPLRRVQPHAPRPLPAQIAAPDDAPDRRSPLPSLVTGASGAGYPCPQFWPVKRVGARLALTLLFPPAPRPATQKSGNCIVVGTARCPCGALTVPTRCPQRVTSPLLQNCIRVVPTTGRGGAHNGSARAPHGAHNGSREKCIAMGTVRCPHVVTKFRASAKNRHHPVRRAGIRLATETGDCDAGDCTL